MKYIYFQRIRLLKNKIAAELRRNISFYVIEHIYRKHFVSLQRYKIKEKI